jgi:hypothetical protein
MVIHKSLQLSLHFPIYEISSIRHAGSQVSAGYPCIVLLLHTQIRNVLS